MRYIPEETHLQTTLTNKLKYICMTEIEKMEEKAKLTPSSLFRQYHWSGRNKVCNSTPFLNLIIYRLRWRKHLSISNKKTGVQQGMVNSLAEEEDRSSTNQTNSGIADFLQQERSPTCSASSTISQSSAFLKWFLSVNNDSIIKQK